MAFTIGMARAPGYLRGPRRSLAFRGTHNRCLDAEVQSPLCVSRAGVQLRWR